MMVMLDVEGYVWCDKHGEVHDDSLNPHGYAQHATNAWCQPEDHHALYRSNPEVEKIMAEPVRSNPIPLTVRRHTEQSRAIYRANLLDAMPRDMLEEDRERIADALLETAITHGNELRRKRLIDKLMTTAEALEDYSQRPNPKFMSADVYAEWSDLMADAAEEIRSIL